MDSSSIVKWFNSDEHHFKRDLKAHMGEKSVGLLRLSEVEEIEKVIEKTQKD
jgi:hypothetical protein